MKFQTLFILISAAIFSGCASSGISNPGGMSAQEIRPDEKGIVSGTGIESQDLVRVCDQMARGILSCPRIANAPTPPSVVLEPVKNETRFPINKDLFLDRIRGQLNQKAQNRVTFLSRDQVEALIRVQDFKGADYLLTGKLQGIATATSGGQNDYVHYDFQLIDPRTAVIVWEDFAEIKKQGQHDAAYR